MKWAKSAHLDKELSLKLLKLLCENNHEYSKECRLFTILKFGKSFAKGLNKTIHDRDYGAERISVDKLYKDMARIKIDGESL
mgnify:CR=1 FL=1